MNKHELVGLTLDRLLDSFKSSPESFEYVDSDRKPDSHCSPSILWQPKVQLTDYMSTVVEDPNNNHAVLVTFNPLYNELTCHLFLKSVPNISLSCPPKADCVVSSCRVLEKWRSNYKKFTKLRDLIIARDAHKENMIYLKKLSSVFPNAVDKYLLGD